MGFGKVYLTGAGPGDPGLITVKAAELLRHADCIMYDLLANEKLLRYARPGADIVFVGKAGGRETIAQREINALLFKKASKYDSVVRLKGGDPFMFGRGGAEAEWLAKKEIPFEIVPGVTSALAVPAYAGIPLTHIDFASSVAVMSGHKDAVMKKTARQWKALTEGFATLVFLMSRSNLKLISERLIKNGMASSAKVAIITSGTMPSQKTFTTTLKDVAAVARKEKITSPVMLVVGEVTGLRERLNWFESMPLFGRKILVTRTREQASSFCDLLSKRGAEPISFPTIKIVPPKSFAILDRAIKGLSGYDWLIFTSANGVKYFFSRLYELGLDVRELKGVKICAIGPMTGKAVEEYKIAVDLMPEKFIAEEVISALGKKRIKGKSFLLARAEVAREVIPTEIKRLGGSIDVAPVYRTVTPKKGVTELKKLISEGGVDVVTFTSSSTVTNFVKAVGEAKLSELLENVGVACIGPVTAKTAKGFGMDIEIMAQEYTITGLTSEMEVYFKTA